MKDKIIRNLRECLQIRREVGLRGVFSYCSRLLDHGRLKLSIRYRDVAQPRRFPRKVQLEASSKCNLRCPSCSHSREKAPGRHLLPQELSILLDRLPFRPASVILSGLGEPLLNPQFSELATILAGRGIEITFFTNGTLLTPQMRSRILSHVNITSVVVSCDSACRQVFEALRLGADFEKWKRFVSEFAAEVQFSRPSSLQVSVHTVLSKHNIAEAESIVRFVASLGFHRLHFLDPIPVDSEAQKICPTDAECSGVDRLRLYEFSRKVGVHVTFDFRRTGTPPSSCVRCLQPWEYILIHSDGGVAPCCAVFGSDRAAIMGNLFEQDFMDIWHGEAFEEFRRSSALGKNALCADCPYY